MPQVKVHIPSEIKGNVKLNLANLIRDALIESLQLDEEIGQVIVYETSSTNRAIHQNRDSNFILIEITMYQGRCREIKEKLMKALISSVHLQTGIQEKDIICTIYEISPENYLGGISHKYIDDKKRDEVE